MFTLSVSFELTVTTQGKSWISETDLQVSWKAPAFQCLCIHASGGGEAEKQDRIKTKREMYLKA